MADEFAAPSKSGALSARVITTGDKPSISLHLLGNDVGCVWRHRFVPETGEVMPFRPGYTNQHCKLEA